eukprot:1461451-Rhodomonas_salina.3
MLRRGRHCLPVASAATLSSSRAPTADARERVRACRSFPCTALPTKLSTPRSFRSSLLSSRFFRVSPTTAREVVRVRRRGYAEDAGAMVWAKSSLALRASSLAPLALCSHPPRTRPVSALSTTRFGACTHTHTHTHTHSGASRGHGREERGTDLGGELSGDGWHAQPACLPDGLRGRGDLGAARCWRRAVGERVRVQRRGRRSREAAEDAGADDDLAPDVLEGLDGGVRLLEVLAQLSSALLLGVVRGQRKLLLDAEGLLQPGCRHAVHVRQPLVVRRLLLAPRRARVVEALGCALPRQLVAHILRHARRVRVDERLQLLHKVRVVCVVVGERVRERCEELV